MKCGKCGKENKDTNAFCDRCGVYLEDSFAEKKKPEEKKKRTHFKGKKTRGESRLSLKRKEKSAEAPKKKFSKKAAVIAAVSALIIAAAGGTAAYFVLSEPACKAPLIYVKENSVMVQKSGDTAPFVLSDNFSETGQGKLTVVFNEKGDKALYSESLTQESGVPSYKLYYRDILSESSAIPSADREKGLFLAANVFGEPKACEGFKKIAYLRSLSENGGKLKVHNLKEEISIDSDVTEFYISDDGKRVVYLKKNGDGKDLYICKVKSNPEPKFIKDNVESLYFPESDLKKFAFTKKGSENTTDIFSVKNGKVALISSDIKDVYISGEKAEEKELYFTQEKKASFNWKDLVIDDFAETDKNITEPVRDKFPDEASFKAAEEEYKKKQERDSLRAAVSDGVLEENHTHLCRVVKGHSELITENLGKVYGVYPEAVVYSQYEIRPDEKLKISDFEKYGNKLPQPLKEGSVRSRGEFLYAAKEDEKPLLLTEDAKNSKALSLEDEYLYIGENCNKTFTEGDIVRYSLEDGKNARIDAGVYLSSICSTPAGGVYYLKDVKEGAGDLYAYSGKKSEIVQKGTAKIYPAGENSVFFMTDFNVITGSGTLGICEKTKGKYIDTNVKDGMFLYKNEAFYVKGFSSEKGSGSLYRNNNRRDALLVGEYVSQIF